VTPTLTIGPLLPIHRSGIEEIVRATGVFNDGEVAVALELFDEACSLPLADSASRDPQADYEFIGAFEGDRLIGYACFGLTPSTDRTYDLYWIAVHPDAQRSGAGAALMDEVERQLEARRARLIVVETSSRDDYAPTRGFYHKRGYDEAARVRGFYAPEDDRVVLSKRIGAAFGGDERPTIAPHTHE
jgi:ribosomal protein S18 acetylase RimI-like enzyme